MEQPQKKIISLKNILQLSGYAVILIIFCAALCFFLSMNGIAQKHSRFHISTANRAQHAQSQQQRYYHKHITDELSLELFVIRSQSNNSKQLYQQYNSSYDYSIFLYRFTNQIKDSNETHEYCENMIMILNNGKKNRFERCGDNSNQQWIPIEQSQNHQQTLTEQQQQHPGKNFNDQELIQMTPNDEINLSQYSPRNLIEDISTLSSPSEIPTTQSLRCPRKVQTVCPPPIHCDDKFLQIKSQLQKQNNNLDHCESLSVYQVCKHDQGQKENEP